MPSSRFTTATSILYLTTFCALASSGETDITKAKETVEKIYKQSSSDFLWLKERKKEDREKMRNYYAKFFTESFSNEIANGLSTGNITRYFSEDLDPRFPIQIYPELRKKVLKLKIYNPVKLDKNHLTIRVDYKTDQTDGETLTTVYFLELQKNNWLIDDQDLGTSYVIDKPTKNTKFKKELRLLLYAK